MRKVIVTAATTGGFHGKEVNPNLPEQPHEIAESVYACYKAGAGIAHLHARGKDGKNTGAAEVFREIKDAVREKCDIVISFSTGGGVGLTVQDRIQCAMADPELCSLNMGSLVRFDGSVWANTPSQLEEWATILKQRKIKPELEVYSHVMYQEVENLKAKGLIEKPYFINLVLGMAGRQGALTATRENLLSLIEFLPQDSLFNVTVVGKPQLELTTLGLLMGGNIRVGLEDNVFYSKGVLATNEQVVARTVRIIKELGFEVATAQEARQMLGL
jgi:3-keto-5-aminohexanoate cleavage enzyme